MSGAAGANVSGEDALGSLKDGLRAEWRALRESLSEGDRALADARIRDSVLRLPAFRTAETVFTYLSFGSEVDTVGVIDAAWACGKAVALPRCVGPQSMRWFEVACFDRLEKGPFGIREPQLDRAAEVDPRACGKAVALVPGLSFDGDGYRLGYGGGFYDAFLDVFAGVSVGLCRAVQLSATPLPRDRYDRCVDVVVTDSSEPRRTGLSDSL